MELLQRIEAKRVDSCMAAWLRSVFWRAILSTFTQARQHLEGIERLRDGQQQKQQQQQQQQQQHQGLHLVAAVWKDEARTLGRFVSQSYCDLYTSLVVCALSQPTKGPLLKNLQLESYCKHMLSWAKYVKKCTETDRWLGSGTGALPEELLLAKMLLQLEDEMKEKNMELHASYKHLGMQYFKVLLNHPNPASAATSTLLTKAPGTAASVAMPLCLFR